MGDNVTDLLERLAEIRAALDTERERHQEVERPLLDERKAIFQALEGAGLSRRQIADAAGLRTASSVQKVLKPPRRTRGRQP